MTLRPHPAIRVLESERLFQGRVFDLVTQKLELPSGLQQEWAIVEHPGAVGIAAVDEQDRLLTVRQFRPAAGDWTLEIPAGRLDPGESPLEAAHRELEEETGFRAGRMRPLLSFLPAPGFCSEVIHLFEATNLIEVDGGGIACDEDEEIELRRLTPEDLLQVPILDAKTMIAAQTLLLAQR